MRIRSQAAASLTEIQGILAKIRILPRKACQLKIENKCRIRMLQKFCHCSFVNGLVSFSLKGPVLLVTK
jgi:hypothetical protein